MATAGAQLRFVRCPKCLKVLSEPGGVLMYKCGGCGAVLRAKNPQVAHAGSENSENCPHEKGESSGTAEIVEPPKAVASHGKEKVSENTELLATAKCSEKGSSEAKTDHCSFDQQEAKSLQVREQHSNNSASPESVRQSNGSEGRLGRAHRGRRSDHLRSAAASSLDDGTQTYLRDELKASPAASQSVASEEDMLDNPHRATQSINLRSSTSSSSDGGSRKYHQMSRRTKSNRKGSSEAITEYSFSQEEEEKSLNAKEQDSDKASPESLRQSNGSEQGFGLAHGRRRSDNSSDDGTQNYRHNALKASPARVAYGEEMLEKSHGAMQSYNLRPSTASSSDDGSHKYRQMSRRTIRDQRFSGSVSTKSGEEGDLSRNSSVNANTQRRGSLNSEAFFSAQSWVESEEGGPSRSRSSVSAFSEHPHNFQDASTKLKHLNLLKLVEELRDQLSEKKPRSRLGRSQDTFLDGDYQQRYRSPSQMPVSYLHCHLEPNLCCNNKLCTACSYNSCCHSSKPRRSVQHPKARAAKSYCRPVSGGAPFVVCSNCFEVLHMPADFLVSTSRRSLNKLKCGACSVVMVLPFPARAHRVSDEAAGRKASEDPVSFSADYGISLADSSSSAEVAEPALNVSRATPRSGSVGSSATLHRLMGYGSARLLLF